MQKSDLDDGHLLEILRTKDSQIVELENDSRDRIKEAENKEQQVEKLAQELKTYQDLIEVSWFNSYDIKTVQWHKNNVKIHTKI